MTEPVPDWKRRWNDLLWEPDGTVLRNKLGLRDPFDLRAAEYRITADRQLEIERGDIDIPRTFGQDQVRALHRHLFQDIYSWAGEYRTVGMSKGVGAPFLHSQLIPQYLDRIQELCQDTDWPALGREEFAIRAARVYAHLNVVHPFREGNGRTNKLFVSQLAELTPYRLDFDRVDLFAWNEAARASMPAKPGLEGPQSEQLEAVFKPITVERDHGGGTAQDPELARAIALQRSTYPAAGRPTDVRAGERPAVYSSMHSGPDHGRGD